MRFSLLFLVSFFSIFSINLVAQNHLSFGVNGVTHPDTLYMGDPIEFNFWIVNSGNMSISDSIIINCETFDDLGGQMSGMQLGPFIDTTLILDIGDSLLINLYDTVSHQSYVAGDNLIVIWPALLIPTTASSDTSQTFLHVLDTVHTKVLDEINDLEVNVFPNPFSTGFSLVSDGHSVISYFSISDIIGNRSLVKKNINKTKVYVNTESLRSGVYFIEVGINNQVILRRIIIN